MDQAETSGGIDVNDIQDVAGNRRQTDASAIIVAGEHDHDVASISLDKGDYDDGVSLWKHSHVITASAADTGVTNLSARAGTALTYVDDLRVWFDSTDITSLILEQLAGRDPAKWPAGSQLGDGTATHVLVTEGTQEIDLLRIAGDLGPGEHTLEFKVLSGGGQVHFNLYVE